MTKEQLTELLKSAGVDGETAARRAEEHVETEAQAETLTKSLAALEEISANQAAAEEANAERIEAARAEGELSLAELIAPSLDAMLDETRAQNDALAKGFTGALEMLANLAQQVKRLEAKIETRPEPAPAAPMAKSVAYIPAPHEEAPRAPARDDLLKSLATTTPRDPEHAAQLFRAVAALESGADPHTISSRFNF
jgi:hypothetical protein